jgi:2-methylcitrate dehydratase PrpD
MWTFIHLIGGAAAAASLLRLDAWQAAHAMAIALAQPTYPLQPGFFGPTSKLLAAAIPTRIGPGIPT